MPPAVVTDLTIWQVAVSAVIFVAAVLLVLGGWAPFRRLIRRQEDSYESVLHRSLLLDISPRAVTLMSGGAVVLFAVIAYALIHHFLVALAGALAGLVLPVVTIRFLKRRRMSQLEEQLVDGIQTLTSGVRAGLNLIQAMELLAHNALRPISEEFGHLLREYEHGISLEHAMQNAASRIGSSNYRLLFSALLTHRERGGDLGETLSRIADSIREIHRLEKRIEALTAPGRTAARWMGAMPLVILGILYMIDPYGVSLLFTEDVGKVLLFLIVLLNVFGFLWIRGIVSIDV